MSFAVFVADGGPARGGGHLARCSTLASALRRDGWRCSLAANGEAAETMPHVVAPFDEVLVRPEGPPAATFLAASWKSGCDVLVTDHYSVSAEMESACRKWAKRIVAVDDLADRAHDCDILVDATPGRSATAYDGLVPASCERLIGPRYALVDSELAHARWRVLPRPRAPARRLLVSLGATDPANLTSVALEAIRLSDLELEIEVLLGPASPHLAEARQRAQALGVAVRWSSTGLSDDMSRADLAIGAAGGSALERCCLGLPTVLLVGADNQAAYAEALAGAGAARLVSQPVDARAVAEALGELVSDADQRQRMSGCAAAVCDGLGTRRIAMALMPPLLARDGQQVRLRPADGGDLEVLFAWQTDPHTRQYARNKQPPTRAEHESWLQRKLADPNCIMNMVLLGGRPAGVVRLDRLPDESGFEVSINVAGEHARRGVGRHALTLARRLLPDETLRAFVLAENQPSKGLFAAAGYVAAGSGWFVSAPAPVARTDTPARVASP